MCREFFGGRAFLGCNAIPFDLMLSSLNKHQGIRNSHTAKDAMRGKSSMSQNAQKSHTMRTFSGDLESKTPSGAKKTRNFDCEARKWAMMCCTRGENEHYWAELSECKTSMDHILVGAKAKIKWRVVDILCVFFAPIDKEMQIHSTEKKQSVQTPVVGTNLK